MYTVKVEKYEEEGKTGIRHLEPGELSRWYFSLVDSAVRHRGASCLFVR